MATGTAVAQQLRDTVLATVNEIIAYLPSLFGALLLLLGGWLLARLVKVVTVKLLDMINHLLARLLSGRTRIVVRLSGSMTQLVAIILFWVTLFIFATAALRVAGLTELATWLEQIIIYMPSVISAGIIILIGYLIGAVVRDITFTAAQSAELSEAELIARLAQAITFVTALLIGLNQLGVDVSFVTLMLGVITAALLAGFALAFGLGARTLVSNLISAHYVKELIEPGQKVRIGRHEGVVLEISSTAIIIDTSEGRTCIPAKCYQEDSLSVLMEDAADG